MKLWVDDLRNPPDSTWTVARTSRDAIEVLSAVDPPPEVMSLDHDLGFDDTTRAVVLWLCDHPKRWPPEVRVHAQSFLGRRWLLGLIEQYKPVKVVR